MSNLDSVSAIFQEIFGNPNLAISTQMKTGDISEWDSFKNVEILLACEKKFAIRFRSKEIDTIGTIGDLVNLIDVKVGVRL
ncbi:acyl carrier protein [Polynucleobacter paneuropaeus]|jgi:acyl carrier protein|nr:acyl carrier protein [Polynucleobacter paneuropaeus]MBT8638562.1 acyl carrier protein [Polynucleobacter paneuropaeus]